MHDLINNIVVRRLLSSVAIGVSGVANGKTSAVVDKQGFDGLTFVIGYGSVTATGGTITPVLLEGDAPGALTSVADWEMLPQGGAELAASLPAGAVRTSGVNKNVDKLISYKGSKRYVGVKLWGTASAGPTVDVRAILFNPEVRPTPSA